MAELASPSIPSEQNSPGRQASERAISAAEAQARLAAIVESSEDAIVSKDLDGTITSWNAAAERLFGYRAEEMVGQSVMRLIPPERSSEESHIIARLQRGERVEHLCTWRRRKDGSQVEVELSISPVCDAEGRVVGAAKIARDITERRRVEKTIGDRDRMLHLAQRAAHAGVWEVDMVSGKVQWSDECHAIYGTDPATFTPVYESWFERVHPEDLPTVVSAFESATDKQGEFSAEFRIRQPERGLIWVWAVGQTEYGADGRPQRSCGIVMDINGRRSAEALLRDSEQRYRSLVAASGAIVFRSDAEARWKQPQPGWEDYTGQTFEQSREHGWAAAVHPDDRARVTAEVQSAVEAGAPVDIVTRLWHAPTGEWRHVEARSVPLRDAQGKVREWVGSCMDVHDRRVAQSRVEELAQNLRLITDAIPALVSYVDQDGRYRFVNRAYETWFGQRSEDVVGRELREVLGEAAYERIRGHTEAALAGERRSFEQEIPYKEGGTRYVRAEYMPDRRPDGSVAGFFALISDISAAKNAEAELRTNEQRYRAVAADNEVLYRQAQDQARALMIADKRKDEFLAVLSHELRNPLAPIRTGIEILRHGGLAGGAAESVLEAMERQTHHLTRLVDDLLEVSRVTRGQIELKREPVVMGTAVHEAVAINRELLDERGHHLELDLPPQALMVDGDRTRLTQVIANLINNAVKYTPSGGTIRVSLQQKGREALLRVSDNGIGIPGDMLLRIFDIFTQVDRSTERNTSGLGIGLSLVKRLVRLHGGEVVAHSAGEGQGSEFVVRLPMAADLRPPAPRTEWAAPPVRSRRIVVIDDNRDAADTLALLLRAQGHDAHQAYDGETGLALAEALQPEIMLLDLGMPGMSGYEVAKRLRQQPWGQSLTLVALTGWGQEKDRAQSLEAGFDRHLVKPVQQKALQEILGG